MATSVQQILASKGSNVFCVRATAPLREVMQQMFDAEIGAVVVTQNDRIEGIFTERDFARKVGIQAVDGVNTPVGEVMTPNVLTVSPTHTMDHVMNIMTNNRVRHLPVVEKGKLCGIITIGDVIKATIAEHEATIRQLSSYIAGDIST